MREIRPRRWKGAVLAAVLGLALAGLAVLAHGWLRSAQFEQAEERARNTLGLAVAVLRGHLARYENLPELIAEHEQVHGLFRDPANPARIAEVNLWLEEVNGLLEASDIYVMDTEGTTISASNHHRRDSFIGHNFSYRPYFLNALAGGQGRFFALGTTSLTRGYYFGAPVRIAGEIVGVVVFKVDIDAIETEWRGSGYEILVTDPEGIVFMSGRPEWLFTGIEPLTEERLERTQFTRRYANAALLDLPVQRREEGGRQLLAIAGGEEIREYLLVSQPMPEAEWTVKVLLDMAPVRAELLASVVSLLLLAGLGVMGALFWWQRRARLTERIAVQREAQELLERRVEERTHDLAEVNRRLEEEIEERRTTERALRKTQSDLVQAGKLAALGQMSAALSHEFNQPLAAVRANAENSLVLIERGRIPEARENIDHIARLVERMAELGRHLRNFARRPNRQLHSVDLAEVLEATMAIIDWRLRAADVSVTLDLGLGAEGQPLRVRAGSVRLQQVLVNILANAADAVEGREIRQVRIEAREAGGRVRIAVQDSGPGISAATAGRIFDPFFTTKDVGRGLGLGLSISYNIVKDFGGSLTAGNHEGGAEFVIDLLAAGAENLTEPPAIIGGESTGRAAHPAARAN